MLNVILVHKYETYEMNEKVLNMGKLQKWRKRKNNAEKIDVGPN